MPKRTNDGVRKRCEHPRRQWSKCPDPWHFNYHHGGREYRYSLDVLARHYGERPPRSKTEATRWRDRLRTAIDGGTFVDPDAPRPTSEPQADTRLTFGDVADRYLKEHVNKKGRRKGAVATMTYHVGILLTTSIPAAHGGTVALADKPLADLTADDIDAVREARRAYYREQVEKAAELMREAEAKRQAAGEQAQDEQHRAEAVVLKGIRLPGVKDGEVGINRLLARLRHICTWALTRRPPIIDRHPFKQHGETVIHLTAEGRGRTRRLASGEEPKLLQHAGPHLQAVIIAALETGSRVGELLSLQWGDVLWTDVQGKRTMRSFQLSAAKTKTSMDRTVPITSRLRAVLQMRTTDPKGKEFGPGAYVFGNEVGERVACLKTAWKATCRRPGIVNLHFHDLRREFASRLLESGATLAEVQACLGHANITMTSRYLGTTDAGLQRAFRPFERASAIRTPFAQTTESGADAPAVQPAENPQNVLVQ